MENELYKNLLITWYPFAEKAEIGYGKIKLSKEDYKKNLIRYNPGAIYVMDPLGILHTKENTPILTEGETIKYKVSNIKRFVIVKCSTKEINPRKIRIFFSPGAFENTLPGVIYRTTKRLIFFQNTPRHIFDALGYRNVFSIPEGLRDRRLWKAGRIISASVPLSSICDYALQWRKIGKLYLLVNDIAYCVLIRPCDLQLLEGLPKKEW